MRGTRLANFKWRALAAILCIAGIVYLGGMETSEKKLQTRKLLSTGENVVFTGPPVLPRKEGGGSNSCDAPRSNSSLFPPDVFTEKQLRQGGVAVYVVGILYMFYALALVCDNYFVPSLDVLIDKFKITPDVAGATFMAAGGSAPELFTSIIGIFIAESDVGIGTIVGSAVFNVLFVIAACAFASAAALSLTPWPLVRDTFFYSVALVLLVVFFLNEEILWWEALVLFLWYICYVGFMKFNGQAEVRFYQLFPSLAKSTNRTIPAGFKGLRGKKLLSQMAAQVAAKPGDLDVDLVQQSGLRGLKDRLSSKEEKEAETNTDTLPPPEVAPTIQSEAEEGEYVNPILGAWRGGLVSKISCLLSLPLTLPMFLTIPDTQRPGWAKFFPLTFICSLLWITIFSYLMVWWATVVCTVTGMSDATMGITFLAAGTSVPDLITSVLVAKGGHGDMAVSSSIGSNIFDVTVGLPLPWLIFCAINSTSISVSSAGMACNIGMLFLMLVSVIVSIMLFRWKMTKPMGVVMMALYVVFLSVALSLSQCWFSCDI